MLLLMVGCKRPYPAGKISWIDVTLTSVSDVRFTLVFGWNESFLDVFFWRLYNVRFYSYLDVFFLTSIQRLTNMYVFQLLQFRCCENRNLFYSTYEVYKKINIYEKDNTIQQSFNQTFKKKKKKKGCAIQK